jgi:S-disulfanyl-L-cysteine oxidoreductase SoxD
MRARLTVLVLAAALAACGDWPWRHDMAGQPSIAHGTYTRDAPAGTISRSGELPVDGDTADAQLRNPVAADAPVDRGRTLYTTYCIPCHGVSGAGDGSVSRFFEGLPDLTADKVQQHGDGWLYATITNGTEKMPRYQFELTPDERWQIVHFVRAMGAAR